MKILFVSESFPCPPTSGQEIALFNFIKQLSKRHSIVFTGFDNTQKNTEKNNIDEFSRLCRINGIFPMKDVNNTDITLNIFNPDPLCLKRYQNPLFLDNLIGLLKREKFDLVHFFGFNTAQFWRLAEQFPRVFTPIDCTTLYYRRLTKQPELSILMRVYYFIQTFKIKGYESNVYKNFNSCYVFSAEDQKNLIGINPRLKVFVMPFGVEPPEPIKKCGLDLKKPVMAISGNMSSKVNVDSVHYFYEKIFPLVRNKYPNSSLLIVGTNPHKSILEIAKNDKNVVVTGFVEDIWSYINIADIYIAPVLSAVGIQSRLLEPMALGKAIVSTSQPVKIFNAVSGEHVLIEDDAQNIASSVIRLIEEPELRDKLGRAAKKLVQARFGWEAAASRLEDIHSDAIKSFNKEKQ